MGDFEFAVTDPDFNDTHKFQIVGGLTSGDNQFFDVVGNKLVILNEIDLGNAAERDYIVNVEAVDSGGLSCTIDVTVRVMDFNKPHKIINLPRIVELNALASRTNDIVSLKPGIYHRSKLDMLHNIFVC